MRGESKQLAMIYHSRSNASAWDQPLISRIRALFGSSAILLKSSHIRRRFRFFPCPVTLTKEHLLVVPHLYSTFCRRKIPLSINSVWYDTTKGHLAWGFSRGTFSCNLGHVLCSSHGHGVLLRALLPLQKRRRIQSH